MSETKGSGDDSSTSSGVVDSVSQDLSSAESFTILIHGVGAETSQDLLKEAGTGYFASGFRNAVVPTKLSECPALSQEKVAEAILIKGQKGGHFVIALPWNNRVRLASLAQTCLILLSLLSLLIAADPWKVLLFKSFAHRPGEGLLLFIFLSCAKWTVPLWAPWLWVFASLLIVALWIIASHIIIPCIPIARTKGWTLMLTMLVLAVTFISLASVHTIWFVSNVIPTDNLATFGLTDVPVIGPYLIERTEARAVRLNISETLPPALTPGNPPVKEPDSKNKISSKTEQIRSHIRKPLDAKLKVRSDFVTCLFLILICIFGIGFADGFGWVLDFGLDVLHYGGDQKYNDRMFHRLRDAIRWLHSQAPNAHLTVVAHSLGTVIASQALNSISDSEPLPSQISLITLGSPLNYLYRVFPNVLSPRELSAAICSKAPWINLWRRSDGIGRELDVESGVLVQYCIGEGGHEDYWADGAVWKAVVYESLKIGDFSGKVSPPGDTVRCDMEVHLGLRAAQAIVLILLIGIVVWIVPYLVYWLLAFVKAHYHAPH
jgi:hypothetical protein